MNNQEGEPILKVNVKDSSFPSTVEFKSFQELPEAKTCQSQIEKLNRAQNLLYLHEIFSTLCWESRLLDNPIIVKENRLIVNINGVMNLEVDFIILPEKHWFGYKEKETDELLKTRHQNELIIKQHSLLSDALIVFLRELLREKHRSNSCAHFSLANPIAGPVQIPLNHRYRGTQFYRAIDYSTSERSSVVFLLPLLIDGVIFHKARTDLMFVLDKISIMPNGSIFVRNHIQLTQSMLNCSVSVVIGCSTYNSLQHFFTLNLSVSKETVYLTIISDQLRHDLIYESIDVELLTSFFKNQIWNFKIDVINKLATIKHNWRLIDLRLSNSPNSIKQNDIEIIVISNDGRWLLSFGGTKNSDSYQLSVKHSQVECQKVTEWKSINLLMFQKKLIKNDLETIDVLLTAWR